MFILLLAIFSLTISVLGIAAYFNAKTRSLVPAIMPFGGLCYALMIMFLASSTSRYVLWIFLIFWIVAFAYSVRRLKKNWNEMQNALISEK